MCEYTSDRSNNSGTFENRPINNSGGQKMLTEAVRVDRSEAQVLLQEPAVHSGDDRGFMLIHHSIRPRDSDKDQHVSK